MRNSILVGAALALGGALAILLPSAWAQPTSPPGRATEYMLAISDGRSMRLETEARMTVPVIDPTLASTRHLVCTSVVRLGAIDVGYRCSGAAATRRLERTV